MGRVEHGPFIDELIVWHRESAGVRDPIYIDYDDGAGTGMLRPEVRFETAEFSVIRPYHPSSTEQPQDSRITVERAEHHCDTTVVTEVRDCFYATAE